MTAIQHFYFHIIAVDLTTHKINFSALLGFKGLGYVHTLVNALRAIYLYVFVWKNTSTVQQCFTALHKNKWPLSAFSYNAGYVKAPHLLVCFCFARRTWIWCI